MKARRAVEAPPRPRAKSASRDGPDGGTVSLYRMVIRQRGFHDGKRRPDSLRSFDSLRDSSKRKNPHKAGFVGGLRHGLLIRPPAPSSMLRLRGYSCKSEQASRLLAC